MHESRGTKMSNPVADFACAAILGLLGTVGSVHAADKVVMGTGWLAQAEHGGFYQAVVDGTYAKYGLDVSILMGGPQTPTEES